MIVSRNFPYEIWLATVNGAPESVIVKLRAEEAAAIREAQIAAGLTPDPEPAPPTRVKGKRKFRPSDISLAMVDRARRGRAPANHASRADLLGPSRSISMSDHHGGTSYADFLKDF